MNRLYWIKSFSLKEKLHVGKNQGGLDRLGVCDETEGRRAELESSWPGYQVESVVKGGGEQEVEISEDNGRQLNWEDTEQLEETLETIRGVLYFVKQTEGFC